MNRFKTLLLGSALLGSAGSVATGADTILAQIDDPGSLQFVNAISEGVTVYDFIGMEVTAHHCSGPAETIQLSTGYIPGYPASYAPPELHTACAVGSNWSVHVFTNSAGRKGFCFRSFGAGEICAFEINGLYSSQMLFDRTNPSPGSPGSGTGLDATVERYGYGSSGWPGNADYNMYYIDEVSVRGMAPRRDVYARMYIEMVGSPHDTGDVVSFVVDMDFAAERPSEPDPQDSSTGGGDHNGNGNGNGGPNEWWRRLFRRGGRSVNLPR